MDDDEGAEPSRQEHTLIGVVEPDELAKYDTEERQIVFEDVPERFQTRPLPVTSAEEEELSLEAEWIFQAFSAANVISQQDKIGFELINCENNEVLAQDAREKIQEALGFIRNQKYEVPFIAFYRKEHFDNYLAMADLWKIYEYDEKVCKNFESFGFAR